MTKQQRQSEMDAITDMVMDSKDRWANWFDTALLSMLDYEMTKEARLKATKDAAEIADAALFEFENRWGA